MRSALDLMYEIGVDIDKEIPCEGNECDHPASWRFTYVCRVCGTIRVLFCGCCKRVLEDRSSGSFDVPTHAVCGVLVSKTTFRFEPL